MKKIQKLKTKKLVTMLVILAGIPLIILSGFMLFTSWEQKSNVNKVADHLNLNSEYRKISVQSDQSICGRSDCTTITWEIPKSSRAVFEDVVESLKQNGFSVNEEELYYLGNPKVRRFIFRASYQKDNLNYDLQIMIEEQLSEGQSEASANFESKLIIQFNSMNAFTF